MKDIQKRELLRSIRLIQSLGCSYRIISPDGDSFGDLQIAEPKAPRTRRPLKYDYGVLTKYIKENLNFNAEVGTVQEIACGDFSPVSLRSCACSILTKLWGKDTYVTVIHEDRFEVMRTALSPLEETAGETA